MPTPVTVTLVTGFRQRLPAGNYCGFHAHNYTEIVYHPSGSGITCSRAAAGAIHFLPGSVVVYPPGVAHDQRMATAGEDCCLIIRCRRQRRCWPERTLHLPLLHDPCTSKEILALGLAPSVTDDARAAVCQARALAVVLGLLAEQAHAEAAAGADLATAHVQKALRHVDENLQTISGLADVARAVGVSGEYLRHVFVRQTGDTLSRYLVQTRVRRTSELLRHTRLPLKAIAAACGFQNERYLCAVYKKATGRTPGQQRQLNSLPGSGKGTAGRQRAAVRAPPPAKRRTPKAPLGQ